MAKLETDFNKSPYFDDYVDEAEGKDYHRVLFKPGLAVQTRELTQLQSILQEQIARFGDNVFKEGTVIDGCAFQYDANAAFVRLQDRDPGGNTVTVTVFANSIVTGLTSGVRAQVVATASGTTASFPDTNVLLVKYLNGGTSGTAKTFTQNETLSFLPADGGGAQQANTYNASSAFGFGSVFRVGEGVVFGKGHFVNVNPQTIILEKFSTKPSFKVGFKINENLVGSDTDSTLLDNARGSYNYSAPGADRLKLTATLTKKVLGTANTESFLPIFEVDTGAIRTVKNRTVYDVLGDRIAERTYDESGNYEIKKMKLSVKEHYDTGVNFGRWASGLTRPVANTQRLAIGVEPGEAYVQGYHQEHLATVWIDTDKGIDTANAQGINVNIGYSNYIDCANVVGSFNSSRNEKISLRSAATNATDGFVYGADTAAGSEIGTARVRSVEYVSGTPGHPDGTYRFYLTDIELTNGSFEDVRGLFKGDSGNEKGHADVKQSASLTEPSFNRAVFNTGLYATKRYVNASGNKNASYKYRHVQALDVDATGTKTLPAPSTHSGSTETLDYGAGLLTNAQKNTILVVNGNTAVIGSNVGTGPIWTSGSSYVSAEGGTNSGLVTGDLLRLDNGSANEIVQVGTFSDKAGKPTLIPLQQAITIANTGTLEVNRYYPPGYIFDFTGKGYNGDRTITVNAGSTTAALDFNETFDSSFRVNVHINRQKENATADTKTPKKNRYVKIDCSSNVNGSTGPWSLGFSDVYKIRKVYLGDSVTGYSTDNTDVTRYFRLVKNQTDSFYKTSKLELRNTNKISLSSSSRLLVELDYFNHEHNSGLGFFTVDSYPIDDINASNTSAIMTHEIPIYDSIADGNEYNLRDSIDFRPRYTNTSSDSTTLAGASINPTESTTLDLDTNYGLHVPVASSLWQSDVQYYLRRIDRVVIGKDGKKRIVRGVPAQNPIPPQQPAESMSLGLLFIPAYPSLSQEYARSVNRLDLAVKMKPLINKRYTMKDIAALDQRIGNLEYYTSLNLLEKAATDLQIPDDNGVNRFKNGIFVDSFYAHNFADNTNVAYSIAIDSKKGEIRPKFEMQNIDLALNASQTTLARRGRHARLTVTGATAYEVGDTITDSLAVSGTVRALVLVSGSPDAGSATYRLYVHNVTAGSTFSTGSASGGGGGTISQVQSATTTDALMIPYTHDTYVRQPWATNLVNPVTELLFEWVGAITLVPEADHWNDITTLPEVNFDIDLAGPFEDFANAMGTNWQEWNTTERQEIDVTVDVERSEPFNIWGGFVETTTTTTTTTDITETIKEGIRVNVEPFTNTQSTGPFVTEVGTVPFIRSREVEFTAYAMRPNTTVYPYFEDVDVAAYVKPTGGEYGDTLTTDSNGVLTGVFLIPNNDTLKFRVGERTFKLIDIQDLVIEAGNSSTVAVAMYNASGLTVSQKGISLTTREPVITGVPVTEVITDIEVTSEVEVTQRVHDPVAQTFVIGEFEYINPNRATTGSTNFGIGADGINLTAVDLFFERKPVANNGVTVEIREVHNGNITSIRVPFGLKRLERDDINLSSDGLAVTPFYFDAPVYLRGGREYCFIVKPDGNDPGYRMWTARLGGTDVATGALVDQQPAVGMMFTSANDRTYSPRQNEDVKFTLWRANFTTKTDYTAVLENQNDEYLVTSEMSGRFTVGETVVGEREITLSSNSASLTEGDKVTFGSRHGFVRRILDTTDNQVRFKTDLANNSVLVGQTLTFKGTGYNYTFTGVVSSTSANTIGGTVQYYNQATGDMIIDGSSGGYLVPPTNAGANTVGGYIRGLSSNTTAKIINNRDYAYNLLSPKLSIAQYVDTNVSLGVKPTTNSYSVASDYTPIGVNSDYEFYDNEKVILGKTGEDRESTGKTLSLKATMNTNSDRLSPILDLGRSKSVVVVKNIINNTANNEFGNSGKAKTKYISKKIILADGQDAEDLRVILDAYRPAGTDVHVYARFQNAYDSEEFSDKHYTKLVPTITKKRDSSITNKNDFIEIEYNVPTSRDSTTLYSGFANSASTPVADVVQYKAINQDIMFESYKYVSIKIVLTSSGSHLVPRVRALRAIALQR